MQTAILKKTLVAVIFAVILVLTVHRAAADEFTLPQMPAYETQQFSVVEVNCNQIKTSLRGLENSIFEVNKGLVEYAKKAALVHEKWHRKFMSYEGRRQSYAAGEFVALVDAVEKIAAASEEIFRYEDLASQLVVGWGEQVMKCSPEQTEWAHSIEVAANRSREHFSATANFFAQIQEQLGGWVRVWSTLEGKTEVVPEGYFQALADFVDVYEEGAQLFQENAVLSLDPLQVIRESDIAP